MPLFYPTLYRERVTDITPGDLRGLGVRGLLLDVDNTLARHGSQFLDPAVEAWLAEMKAAGISLTIVSNALPRRVEPFARRVGLRFIAFACKPGPFGFLRGARRLGLPRKQCAAVGDQVFTDILGANLCGIPCIQLQPIEPEKKPLLRFKRRLEAWLRRRQSKRERRANEERATGRDDR